MNPFERIQGAFGAMGGQSPQQQQMGVLPPAAQMASQPPQTGMFAKFNNHLQDNRSAMMAAAAGMMGGPGNPGSIGQGFQNYVAANPLDAQRQEKSQNKNATHDWLKKNGHSDEEIAFFQANPQVMAQALKPKEGADALKLFGQEQDLRKEYSSRDETKDFNDVLGAYKKVRTSAEKDSGAGDLSLIFGFMKMVDPGSTVREGEFATAQNSAGIDERLRGMYNQVINGTRLSPDQRADFVTTADGMYRTHAETMQSVQGEYSDIAGAWGVDPSRIFQPAPEFQPMQVGQEVDAGSGIKVRRTN